MIYFSLTIHYSYLLDVSIYYSDLGVRRDVSLITSSTVLLTCSLYARLCSQEFTLFFYAEDRGQYPNLLIVMPTCIMMEHYNWYC